MTVLLLLRRRSRLLLDLYFTGGALPGGASLTRASGGGRFDATGTYGQVANNAPRFDYDPVTLAVLGLLCELFQRTNSIRNNAMVGAVAGSPGTLPDYWTHYNPSGVSTQVVATGVMNGMNYVDLRVYGTPSGSSYFLQLDSSTQIPAVQGEVWAYSLFAKLVGGSLNNMTPSLYLEEKNGSGSYVASGSSPIAPGATLARQSFVRTLGNASTVYVQPKISFSLTAGLAIDATIRLMMPQLEKVVSGPAAASSPILTSGAAATRAAESLQFTIPTGVTTLRYTFDDDSTQDVAVVAGFYTVPATLNRRRIKRIRSWPN